MTHLVFKELYRKDEHQPWNVPENSDRIKLPLDKSKASKNSLPKIVLFHHHVVLNQHFTVEHWAS